jgi:hypothetical protein
MAGLPPGAEKAAASAVERANSLQAAGNEIPAQRSILDNMEADLAMINGKTGPQIEIEKSANALSQRLLGFGVTMSAKELMAAENFDKLARQMAQAQAQSFHSSDASLNNALGANPHTKLSTLGIQGILGVLQGNLDALAVKHEAWSEFISQPGNENKQQEYDKWSRTFNKDLDPRAFQFARMAPDMRRKFLDTMTEAQRNKLERKLFDYEQRGWLTPQ